VLYGCRRTGAKIRHARYVSCILEELLVYRDAEWLPAESLIGVGRAFDHFLPTNRTRSKQGQLRRVNDQSLFGTENDAVAFGPSAPVDGADRQLLGTETQRPQTAGPWTEPWARRVLKIVARGYMTAWHKLRVEGSEHLPPRGPALVMINHTSILDVAALMAADPYPNTVMVVKATALGSPITRRIGAAWSAIGVKRDGRDVAGVMALMAALRAGRVVALAPEGHRSRNGHMNPIPPEVGRLAVRAQVPVIPVGVAGSFEALPPGAHFPRRSRILLRVGQPLRFTEGTSTDEAVRQIHEAITALLPVQRQTRPVSRGDDQALTRVGKPNW
jgi:1-acyl-sn-glycerol-3-phosphate acyltransferase